ncbi:hypothetical protein BRC77_08295 [Halobacteriales archaeon QH_8_64_26]|nr:MAG: hypothetical protein BRC77_08295 [Halobacteriales archaeon QH_8_64_26]
MSDDAGSDGFSGDREVCKGASPVDFDRLDLARNRVRGDDRFVGIEPRPEFAPNRLVCTYDRGFYPETVADARLETVWFENDDFSIHYHEDHETDTFDHRWDRHPSEYNTREHVHSGPTAPTPGVDTSYPWDWRDVLSAVLSEVEDRQRAFWTIDTFG